MKTKNAIVLGIIPAGEGFHWYEGDFVKVWRVKTPNGNNRYKVRGWAKNKIQMIKEMRERSFDENYCKEKLKSLEI